LEKVLTNSQWKTLQNSITPPSLACSSTMAVYSLFLQIVSDYSGLLHIRLNGLPVGPPKGTIIDLGNQHQPAQFGWGDIVPFFSSPPLGKFTVGQDPSADMSSYFNGKVAEIVAYNKFLDPLLVDLLNLRKIEAIEWQLASKWGFPSSMAPARPDVPKLIAISTQAQMIGAAKIQFEFTPQGAGYSSSTFSQTLNYVDDQYPTASPVSLPLEISQSGTLVTSLNYGHGYQFWIESALTDGCGMVLSPPANAGDSVDILIPQ